VSRYEDQALPPGKGLVNMLQAMDGNQLLDDPVRLPREPKEIKVILE